MLNPPPLTFFVRVLRCVNGKEYFSAILRAEWAGYTPAVFKVPLKKKNYTFFMDPWWSVWWLSALGWLSFAKEKN